MRYTFNVFDGPFGLNTRGAYCALHSDGTVGLEGPPRQDRPARHRNVLLYLPPSVVRVSWPRPACRTGVGSSSLAGVFGLRPHCFGADGV